MALAHNVLIRGLNSIYLQAPNIKPEDHSDFINYCKSWCQVLENHHTGEETTLFPQIEKITGEAGIMDVNVEQHRMYQHIHFC
jgi:hemerythrin-like domain-containing protein